MRKITPGENLSLNTLLQMETNALAVAKAGVNAITDPQLKSSAQSGITATQARIMGLQQFITENHLINTGEVH
ncbi:MAG TPA: hypothetical protein DDW50_10480 [Firmicutes bacterium]|nr:hypothetical protein [Bacillota bacterium]